MKKILLTLSMFTVLGFSGNFEDAERDNYKKAVEVYQNIKNKKFGMEAITAQLNLGYMYEVGKGVSKNLEKASKLYSEAKENSLFGLVICIDGSNAEREKDYLKAINFYQKGVDINNSRCINYLADLYKDRSNPKIKRNTEKAKMLYLLASDLGDKEALIKIGDMYRYNEKWQTSYKNLNKALKYYKMSYKKYNNFSSKKEIAETQLALAELYLFGDGVKQNSKKALQLYEKALYSDEKIMKNNPGSTYNLARIYANSNNFKKAFPLYLNAAENGSIHAYNNIGYCYSNGKGVKKDAIKAYTAYMKAAKQGDSTAQHNLDVLCKESPWACKE
jgi:TPR repeat protein